MNEIQTILDIENEPSTNGKIGIIQHQDHPNLRDLFCMAYDDFKVFGIKNLDFTKATETKVYLPKKHQEFMNILDMLMRSNINQELRDVVIKFLESCPNPQQDVYYRVLIKDLKIGVSAKSVNKAYGFPLIPIFSLMACEPLEEQDLNTEKIIQKKEDGYRCLIVKRNSSVTAYSRNGNIIPLKTISVELEKVQGVFVLDGELVADTRTKTSGICNSLIKGNSKVDDSTITFRVFDLLEMDEFDSGVFKTPLKQRLMHLGLFIINNKFKRIKETETYLTYSTDDVMKHYKLAREKGEEGIIVKDPLSLYEPRRSQSWLKVKAINSCTLKVLDKYEHKRGGTLGGLVCSTECGSLEVNVGGGFSDELRKELWETPINGMLVEVLYNEMQKDKEGKYFMFLPRFKEVRTDKEKADSIAGILKEEM